jgi:hypothetical protein
MKVHFTDDVIHALWLKTAGLGGTWHVTFARLLEAEANRQIKANRRKEKTHEATSPEL